MSLRVGQEAPNFTATAVYDQEFKEITLSSLQREMGCFIFLSTRFYICMSNRNNSF